MQRVTFIPGHIQPRSRLGDDVVENPVALSVMCHQEADRRAQDTGRTELFDAFMATGGGQKQTRSAENSAAPYYYVPTIEQPLLVRMRSEPGLT